MAIASPYNQYEMTKVLTSSQGELIVLLYKRSIALLDKAIEDIEASNFLGSSESIGKVCKIVEYLLSTLDMEKGGIIAENLSKLYDFCLYTLTVSNGSNDKEGIIRVKGILAGLLEAWEEIKDYE
ncbi:MAG: flagellar export chaperone FliS [bacterium]